MAIRQARPKRKATGKRYVDYRKKKICELGSGPSLTKIDDKIKVHTVRVRGSAQKKKLIRTNIANIFNPTTKKYAKAKIITVLENPSNIYYVRRNILVKGTIINTDLGKARITSRPGQEGIINAVLIK
jgi:small subunit ribosomal protein S8e